MKKITLIIIKIAAFASILSVIISVIFICVFLYLNRTNKLNGIARDILNRYVAGEMYFEDLNLNFRHFPLVNVKANNGFLISHLNKYPTDTLCRFKKLDVTIDVMRLMDDSLTVAIPEVSVQDGFALVTINKNGVPGWNVWRFKPPRPKGEKPKRRERLFIEKVHLSGRNHFMYYNERRKRSMDIYADSLYFHGSIRIKYKEIYVSDFYATNARGTISLKNKESVIGFSSPRVTLSSMIGDSARIYSLNADVHKTYLKLFKNVIFHGNDSILLRARGGLNIGMGRYIAKGISLGINRRSELYISGLYNTHADTINSTVKISTPDAMRTIRDFRFDSLSIFRNIDIAMPLTLTAGIRGNLNFGKKLYPSIYVTAQSTGGKIRIFKYGILKDIDIIARSKVDMFYPDSAQILIDKLNFAYKHSLIETHGTISGGQSAPVASMNIYGNLYISDFSKYLFPSLEMTGHLITNADITLPLYKNALGNDTKIEFNDSIRFTNLRFSIPGTMATVDSKQGTILLTQFNKLYPAEFDIKLNKNSINSVEDMDISIDRLNLNGNIIKSPAASSIPAAVNGNLNMYGNRIIFENNDTLSLDRFTSEFNTSLTDMSKPKVEYFAFIENLSLTSPDSMCLYVNNIGILSEAILYNKVDFSNYRKYKLWDVIGDWKYKGMLDLNDSRFIMRQLPILSKIPALNILFTENNIKLNNLLVQIGNTNVTTTGYLKNWHNYVFKDSTLEARADIKSSHVDINQLLPAVIKGAVYAQNNKKPSRKNKTFLEVPGNLNVDMDLHILNTQYKEITADTAHASIKIIDKGFYIENLNLSSNVATLALKFKYLTPASDYADADFSFNMYKFNAGQLIGTLPEVIKSSPLLSTFEGSFNASMDAAWRIDSSMSVIPQSVVSAAFIEGRNLSVEKRKIMPRFIGWLLFGKRERLSIDSITMNLEIKDNTLYLQPLTFNIGKYGIGASGIATTDYLYYHIALLKSPLRIKFGFDIYGSPKKLHYRLTSYKNKSFGQMQNKLSRIQFTDIIPPRLKRLKTSHDPEYADTYFKERYKELKQAVDSGKTTNGEIIHSTRNKMKEKLK